MVFEFMSLSVVENIDCMTRMREAPDNHWDLAICDPPYGIGASVQCKSQALHATKKWPNPKIKFVEQKTWDMQRPPLEYFSELVRVSSNQIIWGANYFGGALRPTPSFIVWDKLNGGSNLADCELAWTSFNSAVRKFSFLWNGFQVGEKTERIHPTQKPVALYKWLLTNYAKQGDTILDTHLGSQSSRIAAWDLGFDFVGYETDLDYFRAGNERFENHRAQGKLFSPSDAELQPSGVPQNLFDAQECVPLA